jgi:peroxiredoxin
MAETPSIMVPLGTKAHPFKLPDTVSGENMTLSDFASEKATVIMFICNHCPFVKHVLMELVNLANDYMPQGISFVAISANDVESYPADSPEYMKEVADRYNFPFAYLYDESQDIARSYQAACTPDFYVFDRDLKLVYRGQLDSSRPGNDMPVTGEDMRKALDQILGSEPVSENQKPSIGCNIKWKKTG